MSFPHSGGGGNARTGSATIYTAYHSTMSEHDSSYPSSPLLAPSLPVLPRSQAPRPVSSTPSSLYTSPSASSRPSPSLRLSDPPSSSSSLPISTPPTTLSDSKLTEHVGYPPQRTTRTHPSALPSAISAGLSSSIASLASMSEVSTPQTGASKMAAAAKLRQGGIDSNGLGTPLNRSREYVEEDHPLSESSLQAR